LKVGAKRRRTKQEMLDAKEEEELRNNRADERISEIQRLKEELA